VTETGNGDNSAGENEDDNLDFSLNSFRDDLSLDYLPNEIEEVP
jgi:hypothetical protein